MTKVLSRSELQLAPGPSLRRKTVFSELGFRNTIEQLKQEIQTLYLEDLVPWVVGYSGGKDSTATLQLVWLALAELPPQKRHKTVHVISTDTLVENPVIAAWVNQSLEVMRRSADEQQLPVEVHRLTPSVQDSFWVNLIGKGYPAPRPKFRWCTERLKIKPSNAFITDVVRASGEAILILGTRKAESSARHARMSRLESKRVKDRLSPNASLPNCLVYSPIEEWTNDDVWQFLMQVPNPWGIRNKDLLMIYQGATADGECPLVVDTSTPSCGDSRFGCWVCTLVDEDKSMSAMIRNDEDKEWMLPLLELRNALDFRRYPEGDRHLRDFRRMDGRVQLMGEPGNQRVIPGPYTQTTRVMWLEMLLHAQQEVRRHGPPGFEHIELISLAELREIRRIWLEEKHEIEDLLPEIYERCTGEPYPDRDATDLGPFTGEDIRILREVCGEDELQFQLLREALSVERRYRLKKRRRGLFDELEKVVRRHFFEDEADAIALARERQTLGS